ncbi:MAG TPA: methyltransferase domain-containing protein [Terriglobales bacterium]|jgi:SAM-dependent methyltransferase|nr:methyltransferase domain-containing protein [Terriglobales bacterium]
MKIFGGSSDNATQNAAAGQKSARLTRRSSGLGALIKTLESEETLCVLDLGSTSPANIRYCTERGHKIYSDDLLLSSTDPTLATKDEAGKPILDSKRFLAENLGYAAGQFDIVLCWNLADYLDESLVKPVVGRLWSLLKPGGMLLAFFHTQEAGPDAPCYRYHIVGNDTLEMQHIDFRGESKKGGPPVRMKFRLQRVFNNRHIENLFRDFASIKFFLARDNVREVLVVR